MGECEGKGRSVHSGGGNVVGEGVWEGGECVSMVEGGGENMLEVEGMWWGRTRPDLSSFLLQTMIVLEYMPKGDLRNYLKSRQPQ